MRLATRNLLESRARFVISVAGIALAALLVLMLDGVFEGTQRQVTAYMDNTGFDVVVAQRGVKNLHMTTSFIPASVLARVRATDGVARADPILYATTYLVSGENRGNAYLIGYEPGGLGGPWDRVAGEVPPPAGQVVIDEQLARGWGVGLGDEIGVGGRDVEIGGLTRGTVNVVNSIAFVRFADFERFYRAEGAVSYVLVRGERDVSPSKLAEDLRGRLDNVTVLTSEQFAGSERRIVGDMSVDVMWIMNVFGFLIGLAVVGLTVYTATLAKLREFGILKALGARNGQLFGVVLRQAAASVAVGLASALAIALAISAALGLAGSSFPVAVAPASVLRIAAASAAIGLVSSVVPVVRIAGLKPAEVFRR